MFVTSSSAAVTFAITGPGTIVAVDSASMTNETFRAKCATPYQGIAYALVQATGPGTITARLCPRAHRLQRHHPGQRRQLRSVLWDCD